MRTTTALALLLLIAALPSARAQTGSDNCANATPIVGQGSFAFDNSQATQGAEGQNEPLCTGGIFVPATGFSADVWFSWTADVSGFAQLDTCSTSLDTKLALYPGSGCPVSGTALACNDNSCGSRSSITAQVVVGVTYTIQLGAPVGGTGGTGNLDILILPLIAADDCFTPAIIAGQGAFAYDSSLATTGTFGQGETLCSSSGGNGIDNDLWFEWTPDQSGTASISTCGDTSLDTKLAAYLAGACPTTGSALACSDDSCDLQSELQFTVIGGVPYLLQVGNSPGTPPGLASFNVSISGADGTPFCFCSVSNAPCGNGGALGHGCANSAGPGGAQLLGSGSTLVTGDKLVLHTTGLAPQQPGLYFQGTIQSGGGSGVIFGDGLRCTGVGVVRLGIAVSDAAGNSDTSRFAQPISVLGGILPGQTRQYQLWYRDPAGGPCGASFNLTNGYTITW